MALPAIGIIGALLAKLISASVLRWLALKALIITICTLVLPAVLYNLFGRIFEEMTQYGMDQAAGLGDVTSSGSTVLELTGFAGWIAQEIGLASAMSVFLSALVLRYGLHLIKA